MGGQVSRFVDEIPAESLEREESVQSRPARGGFTGGGARGSGSRGGRSEIREYGQSWEGDAPARGAGPTAAASRNRATTRHRAVGREVRHEQFGRGVVVAAEGEGENARFTVRFGTQIKKVMGRFLSGGDDGDPS
jgi:hypothetical protein